MLCAPVLPPLFSWLELLCRTTLCVRARVCSLLGLCFALCLLSRCRLCLVLLGVAPFRSAPLRVLRPKPRWSRAWSPTWFVFFSHDAQHRGNVQCQGRFQDPMHVATSDMHAFMAEITVSQIPCVERAGPCRCTSPRDSRRPVPQ
jgi:hypothetical protein